MVAFQRDSHKLCKSIWNEMVGKENRSVSECWNYEKLGNYSKEEKKKHMTIYYRINRYTCRRNIEEPIIL